MEKINDINDETETAPAIRAGASPMISTGIPTFPRSFLGWDFKDLRVESE